MLKLSTCPNDTLRRKRIAVGSYYFVPGLVFASWASRIPDVKEMLQLSDGSLGSVLFAIPMGQVAMMAFSGVLVSKLGSRLTIILSILLYSMVLLAMGLSGNVTSLFISLFCFGLMANVMNIATNTQAVFLENMYGRNIMSSFHGMWSLGGFVGGIIGAAFAATPLPIAVHFGVILCIAALIVASGARHLVDKDPTVDDDAEKPKFSFSGIDKTIVLLGLMGFGGMFCEGTVYDWSGVYFASVVKPDAAFLRAGYIAGMGAMTLGRFLADGFTTRYGAVRVLRVCGLLITCGLMLAVLLPYLVTATLGFLLVGFGISSTVPICYSIAGRHGSLPVNYSIMIVSSISYVGFLIGPPILGVISEYSSLRVALSVAAVFGLFIATVSGLAKNRS